MPKKIIYEAERKTNRISTVVNAVEKKKIEEWCKENNTTVYALIRELLLKKVKLKSERRRN